MQLIDHAERGVFGDGKLAAFLRVDLAHHHFHAVFAQRFAHFTAGAKAAAAGELILFRACHLDRELIIRHAFWQVERGHFKRLVGASHQTLPACAKQRESLFLNGDIEIKIVHGFAEHQTRLDQLNFRIRCGWFVLQRRADVLHQRVALILLYLHQRVGAVDGSGEHDINQRAQREQRRNAKHPPARFHYGADQASDIYLVTALHRGGRMSHFFSHRYPCCVFSACAHWRAE
ncbi:hypothetical protein BN129_1833 [Cronobacter sakazakii 701]|nr:hypothetical protein BN129_1833 [Cronobacter sakazakii 701]